MSGNLRASLPLLLSLVVWSSRVTAQSPLQGPVPSVLFSNPAPGPLRSRDFIEPADTIDRDIRPTRWKEGALVGGLIGMAGGTVLGLITPGALIGGQLHKGGPAE